MTASGGGSALADLVTQAPPDDDQAAPDRPSALARLCACVLGRPRLPAPTHATKLAAVVPVSEVGGVQRLAGAHDSLPSREPKACTGAPAVATVSDEMTEEPTLPLAADEERQQACIWGPFQDEPPQLPPQVGENVGRKTLVLDLDETLVHSSFRPTPAADMIIQVELEGEFHKVYVRKRPGVDEFMRQVARFYEVVVYTASMAKYANPLLDRLDKGKTVSHRLFREACTRHSHNSGYMKDLSKIGRELKNVIIIDNSPICYALQPDNAIPIRTWRDDPSDRELLDLVPILCSLVSVPDIQTVLRDTVWGD